MNMNLLEDKDTVFYVLSTCLSKNKNITEYDGDNWDNKEDAFKTLLELYNRNLFDKNDKDVCINVWECIDKNNPDLGNDCIGEYYIEDVIAYFGM